MVLNLYMPWLWYLVVIQLIAIICCVNVDFSSIDPTNPDIVLINDHNHPRWHPKHFKVDEKKNNLRGVGVNSRRKLNYKYASDPNSIYDDFPVMIHSYHVRIDNYTGNRVERGKLEEIGGPFIESKPVSYKDLHRILQCPMKEPNLDGGRGTMSMLEMLQPTRESLLAICAWAEVDCGGWESGYGKGWDECRMKAIEFNLTQSRKDMGHITGSPYQARLIRIINRKLYYDWPWNRAKFHSENTPPSQYIMIQEILDKVHDIADSVFFKGEEIPYMKYFVPFPGFSETSSVNHNDLLLPWREGFRHEYSRYYSTFIRKDNTSRFYYGHDNDPMLWSERIPKAAYYGTPTTLRHMVFDISAMRPDLVEARFNRVDVMPYSLSWNPSPGFEDKLPANETELAQMIHDHPKIIPGTRNSLAREFEADPNVNVLGKKYKYLIVIAGLNGLATSGRLAEYIAHSGAVVLLQTTAFEYHFSAHLKPWVHYVPIGYNLADVARKVAWLQAHDHAARLLAQNAKAFGESYLRLEDYYCYLASAFYSLGRIYNGSTALQGFDMMPINVPKGSRDEPIG